MFNNISTNSEYKKLNDYLNGLGKVKEKKLKTIINSSERAGTYFMDSKLCDEFFELYENTRNQNLDLRIQENPRTLDKSGIVIDFDPKYNEKPEEIDFNKLVNRCCKVLYETLGLVVGLNFRIFITKRESITYNKDDKCYQDGYHFVIPDIRVNKGFKQVYLRKLSEDVKIKKYFSDCSNDISKVIDQNLSYAQIYLFGSSKPQSKPHILYKSLLIKCKKSGDIVISQNEEVYENLSKEISTMFDGEVKSTEYATKYDKVVVEVCEEFDNDLKVANLRENDHEAEFIYNIINSLPKIIFEKTDEWKKFVSAIGNINSGYKCLAIYGSRKCKTEFEKDRTKTLINDIFERSINNREKWGMGKLINWMKEYCPSEWEELRKTNISNIISNLIFINGGKFNDDNYSEFLKYMYSNYLVAYNLEGKKEWYIKRLEGDMKGKWELIRPAEKSSAPEEVFRDIGRDISNYFLIEKKKYQVKINESEDKIQKQFYSKVLVNIQNEIYRVGNTPTKKNIITNLESYLYNKVFYESLNSDPYLMGVNGGILKLPEVKGDKTEFLINSSSPISHNTGRNWRVYSKDDKDIQEVKRIIRDGFYIPEEEDINNDGYDKETFKFLMYHYARGLVRDQKDPYLLNIYGGGSNLKSTLEALIQNTFNSNLSISFSGELLTKEIKCDGPNPNLVSMNGKNYVSFVEVDKGKKLHEGALKYLLSPGESKTTRTLFKDNVQVKLHAVWTSYANYLYIVEGTDESIWRRLLFIKMLVTFVDKPSKPNERLKDERIISHWVAEKRICDAFFIYLNHMYEKLINKYDGKMKNVPKKRIKELTKSIRKSQDLIFNYFDSYLLKTKEEDEMSISIDSLIESYSSWYKKFDGTQLIYAKVIIEKIQSSKYSKYLVKDESGDYVLKNFTFK